MNTHVYAQLMSMSEYECQVNSKNYASDQSKNRMSHVSDQSMNSGVNGPSVNNDVYECQVNISHAHG